MIYMTMTTTTQNNEGRVVMNSYQEFSVKVGDWVYLINKKDLTKVERAFVCSMTQNYNRHNGYTIEYMLDYVYDGNLVEFKQDSCGRLVHPKFFISTNVKELVTPIINQLNETIKAFQEYEKKN